MSEKLTKEIIDNLIQEAMLQEKFPAPYTANDLDKLTKGKNLAKDLADLETNTDELGPNDIRKAFASPDSEEAQKVIDLRNKASNADMRSDLEDVIDDLGGELDTTQKRMKDDDERITQIAGDIDIGPGVAPDAFALTGQGIDKGGKPMTDKAGKPVAPKIKVAKSVIEQMKLFDASSAAGKFQQLQEVADKIASRTFPTDPKEMFKFVTQANVLNYFANMAKVSTGIEAGFEFEKFCAVFMNGLQVGGAKGAADVFLALKNGQVVPTSQKLYAKIGKEIKQSNAGKGAGLYPLLLQQNEIFYFVGIKQGGNKAAEYTNLDMYIIKITKDQQSKHFYGQSMGPEGNYTSPEKLGPFINTGSTPIFPGGEDYGHKLATIPILVNPSADTDSIAQYMSSQMTAGSSDFAKFSKAVIGIFASLQKMEKSTQTFNAKQGQGQKIQSEKYVKEIADSYVALKGDYNYVFDVAGENTRLEENKMEQLDLMVENMVKQFIKGKLND